MQFVMLTKRLIVQQSNLLFINPLSDEDLKKKMSYPHKPQIMETTRYTIRSIHAELLASMSMAFSLIPGPPTEQLLLHTWKKIQRKWNA